MRSDQLQQENAAPLHDYRVEQRLAEQYVNKWEEAGFLEGLPDNRTADRRHLRRNLALVYENYATHLLKKKQLQETTTTGNVGYYARFVFPALRWAFPSLVAHDLVNVQTITSATGNIFFLDYVYDTNKGSVRAGQRTPENFDENYTSPYINGEIVNIGDGTNFTAGQTPLAVTLAQSPVLAPDAGRELSVTIREVNPSTGVIVQEAQANADGSWSGDATAGTINFANGAVTGFFFTAAPASGNQIRAYYYYDNELNNNLPEMSVNITNDRIRAEARKLRLSWSMEAAQDFRSEHGIDLETELIQIGAREMTLEIDRTVVQDLFRASVTTATIFDRLAPAGINELDHLRNIITSFDSVSNEIHRKTLRAPANWIVTSPGIAALMGQFTTNRDYKPITSPDMSGESPTDAPRPQTRHGQFGVFRWGSIYNKYAVYVDPYFSNDFAMLGLRASNYLDSGYVLAPYRPLEVTQTLTDPANFGMRAGLMTRFGRKLLREEFYGQVRVLNMPSFV